MQETPHRMVDDVVTGFADGARGLVNAAFGAVAGAGKAVMQALDKPFAQVTGKEGPHRIIDRAADGVVAAGTNFIGTGVIGSAKAAGEGLMKALDHPIEQVGAGLGTFRIFKR